MKAAAITKHTGIASISKVCACFNLKYSFCIFKKGALIFIYFTVSGVEMYLICASLL